ncbi:outer membrane beta-barrel protein [bacterium]|nr:outer membrane beta-barrel protein [bacterium]
MKNLVLFISFLFITLLQAQEKPNIAILELEGSGMSEQDLQGLTNRLQTEFFKTDKFTVLERSKINEVLEEQQFQMAGCTDLACAIEIGRLLNVEYVVIGNVDKVASIYSVNLRLVDVSTGEIIKNEFEDCPNCSLNEVFLRALKNATHKIAGIEKKPPVSEAPKPQKPTPASTVPQTQTKPPPVQPFVRRPKYYPRFLMGYFMGIHLSGSVYQDDYYDKIEHAGGLSAGITYEIGFTRHIYLKPELVYANRKGEIKDYYGDTYKTDMIHYLHIPLLFSYHFNSNFSLFTGPSFGFFMAGSWETDYDEGEYEEDELINSQLTRMIIGTEARFGMFYLGYRYALDLTSEDKYDDKMRRQIQFLTLGMMFIR